MTLTQLWAMKPRDFYTDRVFPLTITLQILISFDEGVFYKVRWSWNSHFADGKTETGKMKQPRATGVRILCISS